MIRLNSKRIKLLTLGLMVIASSLVYAHDEMNQSTYTQQQYGQQEDQGLEQNLQNLFAQHGTLLNKAIVTTLNDAPTDIIEAGKTRLLENSHQLANAVGAYAGPEAGKTFENLFNQHILLGAQYTEALKAKNLNLANQVSNQAIANGRQLAQFFSQLNPSAVPYATWQKMFDQHNMIEAQQTRAYAQGDTNAGNQIKNESLVQLKELANLAANSLDKQSSADNSQASR